MKRRVFRVVALVLVAAAPVAGLVLFLFAWMILWRIQLFGLAYWHDVSAIDGFTDIRDGTTAQLTPLGTFLLSVQFFVLGGIAGLIGVVAARRLLRGALRDFDPGQCIECGYDLRGTPGSECPECGAAPGKREAKA